MTTATANRQIRLRERPDGRIDERTFETVDGPMPEAGPGQALVQNLYVSIDPTNRAWIGEEPTYLPPVGIGEVMRAVGLGRVVSSNSDDYPEGALVTGLVGWQDYTLAGGEGIPLTVLPELELPIECMLGALGITGITAWFGVEEIGVPQQGETFVVSAAAGAVGSVAGQLAKLRGARVVGIAGGADKCAWLVDDLGFDAAIDRHAPDWREQLTAACPNGVDVDFENVGGDIMKAVFDMLNLNARVPLCGLISEYNDDAQPGPSLRRVVVNRVLIKGFIVLDWFDRFPEAIVRLGALVAEGKVKDRHTIVEGLERAPEACNMLFDGDNVGKLIVKLEE
jgi:NADPH-dependent curcumin reductase CurA